MIDKSEVARLFFCKEKDIDEFDVVDSFNEGNAIQGYICTRDGDFYGSMVITRLNQLILPKEQVIRATPKLDYPYDRAGIFKFPEFSKINLYRKLDGTNICSYHYYNPWIRETYLTYKTRLSPVVRNARFGNFFDMWKQILNLNPQIIELIESLPRINWSFELYGSMNKILILYKVPLDYALLFGIHKASGNIIDIKAGNFENYLIKTAEYCGTIDKQTDLVSYYKKLQAEMEAEIKTVDEDTLTGPEGLVWYMHTPEKVVMLKCKPPTVEGIHQAAGKHISMTSVMITIKNSLENNDSLDYDTIRKMLLEEYEEFEIDSFKNHILNCIDKIKLDLEFKEKVLMEYKQIGLTLSENKRDLMRALSTMFPKIKMTAVYKVIDDYELMAKRAGK